MAAWFYWLIAGLVALVIVCIWIIIAKSAEIKLLEKRYADYSEYTRKLFIASVDSQHLRVLDEVNKTYRNADDALPSYVKVNYRDPFPLDYFEDYDNAMYPFDLPRGISVTKTGEVALGDIYGQRPFGKYTVFVSHSGKCYHSPYCTYAKTAVPACIFTAMQHRTPCTVCRPTSPSTIPLWYTNFCAASRSLKIDWRRKEE